MSSVPQYIYCLYNLLLFHSVFVFVAHVNASFICTGLSLTDESITKFLLFSRIFNFVSLQFFHGTYTRLWEAFRQSVLKILSKTSNTIIFLKYSQTVKTFSVIWHTVPCFNRWLFTILVKLETPSRLHSEITQSTV